MRTGSKFTFDTEFHAGGERRTAEAERRQKKTLTADELDKLQAAARAEGEGSATARNGEAIERAICALTIAVRAVVGQAQMEVEGVRAEAAAIALAAAAKLAPAAIAALPHADVEAALREAMHQAIGEPRLTLRAAPEIAALIEPRLSDIAHEEGYDGRVHLTADPHFHGADCRIEWRGGGAERSFEAIEAALAQVIEQRFSELQSSRVKG
ncbi:MAG TPA: FliH/SctL family protein [Rhizomicrobium sp.]|nr:FliH/SctL family protein [Rhizomicrobium sp.]